MAFPSLGFSGVPREARPLRRTRSPHWSICFESHIHSRERGRVFSSYPPHKTQTGISWSEKTGDFQDRKQGASVGCWGLSFVWLVLSSLLIGSLGSAQLCFRRKNRRPVAAAPSTPLHSPSEQGSSITPGHQCLRVQKLHH